MSLLGKANFNRKDEESVYVEIREYPEARLSDGLLAISVRGPLEFYNAGRLRRRIEMLLEVETKMIRCYRKNYIPETPLTKVYQPGSRANTTFVNSCFDQTKDLTVILDFSRCDSIDTSAVFILHRVVKTFQKQEKRIIFCGLKPVFLTKIQKAGIDELLGEGNIIQKLDEINEM
ncbi:STAS domain-containing protein [Globomyces pollinis-pini]|nr:STAS domain-containing protein [Globomyces pollinis-pini]